MAALLIFLILVAGFLHCHIHPVQKVCLHRYTGQYLYLRAAGYGLRAFSIAATLAVIGHILLPDALMLPPLGTMPMTPLLWLSACLRNAGFADDSLLRDAWLLALSIGTFGVVFLHALGSFLLHCLRHRTLAPAQYITGKLLMDSPLDDLLFRLSLEGKMVMLSMADRKVYVGMIADMGEPTETEGPDNEIALIPILSGYRNKDTLKVEFTTFYKEYYEQYPGTEGKALALTIVLRQKDIVSATEFSDSAYAFWNSPETVDANPAERTARRTRPRYARNREPLPASL